MRRFFNGWLFRLNGPESGTVHLTQRRVFILPSRAGMGFLVMLVALFVGSINFNLSLGLGLTFLLGSVAMVDMYLTFRNLAYLQLAPGRATPVFAGDSAAFDLHLHNHRPIPRYGIHLAFLDAAAIHAQAVPVVADTTAVMLTIPATRRGWMPAPRLRLSTAYPLGLFRAWSYWHPDIRTLVYPAPEMHAPPLPSAGDGNAQDASRGYGDDLAGVRPYRPGDALKHLAWRQIARLDTGQGDMLLLTKEFDGISDATLALDFDLLPATLDVELRLSRMTRWVLEAERQLLAYSFVLGDVRREAAVGPVHRDACLHALALYGQSA